VEDRTFKVVIKGILTDITKTEVTEELENMGYKVKNVRQFGTPSKKLSIHMITLASNLINRAIFNLHSLIYTTVNVESYRSNNPAQCYSCQKFGHSSRHCNYTPRCVKCGGPHLANVCTKKIEEDPTCASCQGTHTANYKECPTFLKIKTNKRPVRQNTIKTIQAPPNPDLHPKLKSRCQTTLKHYNNIHHMQRH